VSGTIYSNNTKTFDSKCYATVRILVRNRHSVNYIRDLDDAPMGSVLKFKGLLQGTATDRMRLREIAGEDI
jgi:hypothetical protein